LAYRERGIADALNDHVSTGGAGGSYNPSTYKAAALAAQNEEVDRTGPAAHSLLCVAHDGLCGKLWLTHSLALHNASGSQQI